MTATLDLPVGTNPNIAELAARLAEPIASELGLSIHSPYPHLLKLSDDHGALLAIRIERGRIVVTTSPDGKVPYGYGSPDASKVTFAADRDPKAVARGIHSRIYADAIAYREAVEAIHNREAERAASKERTITALAAAGVSCGKGSCPETGYSEGEPSARFTVRDGGSVEVDRLYLGAADAVALAEFLRSRAK